MAVKIIFEICFYSLFLFVVSVSAGFGLPFLSTHDLASATMPRIYFNILMNL